MKILLLATCLALSTVVIAQIPQEVPREMGPTERQYSNFLVESIVIKEMPLKDALEELRKKASEASDARVNLNFVFRNGMPARTVTLNLSRVPLNQVIRYFGDVAGLKVQIENAAIVCTAVPLLKTKVPGAQPKAIAVIPKPAVPEKPAKQRVVFTSIPQESVVRYISAITLGWQHGATTKKVESQRQVLFRDTTGRFGDEFFKAVEDLNTIFGYQKLVPLLSTKEGAKEQAIVVFLGPKKDGKKFLYESARQGQKYDNAWDGWFWWDNAKEISKGVIAIYKEEVNEHSLPYYFRRSLLTALGFPGYTRNSGSIFDGYSKPDPRAANTPEGGVAATEFISEFDRAILKFCDRFLATDASRSDMRKIVSKEWPQFAAELEKARNAAPPPK